MCSNFVLSIILDASFFATSHPLFMQAKLMGAL